VDGPAVFCDAVGYARTVTFSELLTMIGTGGGSFGAGAAVVALYVLQKRQNARRAPTSTPPTHRHETAPAPALTDSQRIDLPFVAKDLCDVKHRGVDAQFQELRNGYAELRRGHEFMSQGLGIQAAGLARIEGMLYPQQPIRGGAAKG
jgi:hypothetical protein